MRIKAKTLIALVLVGCVASKAALALDMSGVKAYPVPFNPDRSVALKLNLPAAPAITGIIKISIYDI